MARTTHRYNLKNLKTHELPGASPLGPHQGLVLDPLWALRQPPDHFRLSLCVHIPSRLATPLVFALLPTGYGNRFTTLTA